MIILGRKQALTYFGKEPDIIVQPYSVSQDTWLKQHSTDWLLAQIGFKGTIDSHYPQDRLIKFLNVHEVIFPNMTSLQPLHNAVLVFTDGSSKGRVGYLINNQQEETLECIHIRLKGGYSGYFTCYIHVHSETSL